MKLEKRGLIYCPQGEHEWEIDTFMTPTACLISEDVIRIWGGVRNASGVSRIKYIDVSAQNPGEILYVSDKPVLDIGAPGCFDDNGVILGDVITVKDKLYMYYVGFQHVEKVKFYAFSGLAISDDGGESFKRISEVPVMDRSDKGRYGRCIHSVLHENDIFKVYYAIINDWKIINNIPYPVYNIWYTESEDGIHFSREDICLCVDTQGMEYRIGRPKVYRTNEGYEMYYTRDLVSKEYLVGYARSKDGRVWERMDEKAGLIKSETGWDSQMACYPVILSAKGKKYMFYNGNDMGRSGVGYAELIYKTYGDKKDSPQK